MSGCPKTLRKVGHSLDPVFYNGDTLFVLQELTHHSPSVCTCCLSFLSFLPPLVVIVELGLNLFF